MDDHDLLIRIDERTKATDEKLDELNKHMEDGSIRFGDMDKRFDEVEKEQTKVKTVGAVFAFAILVGTTIWEIFRR